MFHAHRQRSTKPGVYELLLCRLKSTSAKVGSALKTASDYDLLVDAGDTSAALNNFNKITQDFSAIVENSITDNIFGNTSPN